MIPTFSMGENIGSAIVLTVVEFPSFLLGGRYSATLDESGSTLDYDFKSFLGIFGGDENSHGYHF